MKKIDVGEFKIAEHFIVGIEYGDFTGMTKHEVNSLKGFLNALPDNVLFDYSDEKDFTPCNVTGMYSMCLTTKAFVLQPE